MASLLRHPITRATVTRPLRTGAIRAQQASHPSPSTRRYYTVKDKANETEPGGQRKLIVAAAVTVPVLAYYFWLRDSTDKGAGEQKGANQEYKQNAEGNN